MAVGMPEANMPPMIGRRKVPVAGSPEMARPFVQPPAMPRRTPGEFAPRNSAQPAFPDGRTEVLLPLMVGDEPPLEGPAQERRNQRTAMTPSRTIDAPTDSRPLDELPVNIVRSGRADGFDDQSRRYSRTHPSRSGGDPSRAAITLPAGPARPPRHRATLARPKPLQKSHIVSPYLDGYSFSRVVKGMIIGCIGVPGDLNHRIGDRRDIVPDPGSHFGAPTFPRPSGAEEDRADTQSSGEDQVAQLATRRRARDLLGVEQVVIDLLAALGRARGGGADDRARGRGRRPVAAGVELPPSVDAYVCPPLLIIGSMATGAETLSHPRSSRPCPDARLSASFAWTLPAWQNSQKSPKA